MSHTIVAFGELLWDLLPSGPVLGGAPSNLAFRLNSLGDNALIVTRLGRDDRGRTAFAQIARLGMDTRFIQWDEQCPTGVVEVQLDGNGNPDFTIINNVAYDQIACASELTKLVQSAECFCYGTLIQRTPTSRATLRRLLDSANAGLKVLDLNLRKDCYSKETIQESLNQADILKLNENEARHIALLFEVPGSSLVDFAENVLHRWNLQCCLVTLGDRGALVVLSEGVTRYSPGFQVSLGDTCGAGDAFTAGFLHSWLENKPASQCLRIGNAIGALVATQRGATEPLSPEDLRTFLQHEPKRIVDSELERYWIE